MNQKTKMRHPAFKVYEDALFALDSATLDLYYLDALHYQDAERELKVKEKTGQR